MQNTTKMTGEHASVIYGTHYPNRLFVGCLPPEAGAEDLGSFFATYGNVVEAKIVLDHGGNSKRFGFVTFSNPEEVESLIACGEIHFKGKKINVGPAVKKNVRSTANEVQETCAKMVTANPQKTTHKETIPSSIGNAHHTPKTVIRSSPSESTRKVNNSDDRSFQYIWGISTQPSSVWSPYCGEKSRLPNPVGRPLHQDTNWNRDNHLYSNRLNNNLPAYRLSSEINNYGFDRRTNRNYVNNNLSSSLSYRDVSRSSSQSPTYTRTPPRVRTPPGFPAHSVLFKDK